MFNENYIQNIVTAFQLSGKYTNGAPHGAGLINDTFAIEMVEGNQKVRYILQRINSHIFKDPPALMANIELITTHIQTAMEKGCEHNDRNRQLRIIRTSNNQPFYRDSQGAYWRMFSFIENSLSFETMSNGHQVYTAAHKFGTFQKALVTLPAHYLTETIAGFHDMGKRFLRFEKTVTENSNGRAATCKKEIDFIVGFEPIFTKFSRLHHESILPRRVVHNDTKISNVLFDQNGKEAVCVIDLDTAMGGIVISDFGDLCRTSICTVDENEADVSKIKIKISWFESLAHGYLTATQSFLQPNEQAHLVFGFKAIVLEQAMRFLTDHLAGDIYYTITQPEQNLHRARNQIKLAQEVILNEDKMQYIIDDTFYKLQNDILPLKCTY